MTDIAMLVNATPDAGLHRRRVRRAKAEEPAVTRAAETGRPVVTPDVRPAGDLPAGPRILVADTELRIGATIAAMLGPQTGAEVRTVSRAQDALQWAEQTRPDLVMVDVELHGTTGGLDTAAELHRRRAAPVVLMLGEQDPDRERIAASGAVGCVRKPLRPAAVLPAVEVALARSATLVALREQVDDITTRLRHRELIDRAKSLLMSHRGMSEPQAFRWLQRTAMDRRTPMATVAAATIDRLAAADQAGDATTAAATWAVVPPAGPWRPPLPVVLPGPSARAV